MKTIQSEKIEQAKQLVGASDADVWMTFVRETVEACDPILPLLYRGGLTWQSALVITKMGKSIAIVGNYDADPLRATGDWDQVIPYVHSIRQPLLEALERNVSERGNIALNFSVDDVKSDGLAHGMFMLLEQYAGGTRFESTFISAEKIVRRLRGIKSAAEQNRIHATVLDTEEIFEVLRSIVRPGHTELDVYNTIQTLVRERMLGFAWDERSDPIVNSGPDSMVGHGIPSDNIKIEPGHIFHIDLGVKKDDYCSDLQRSWYVTAGEQVPEGVEHAFNAVRTAILAAKDAVRPGVEGWQVDRAARDSIVASGYEEFMHAVGHQVGRVAHDGGTILGPKWERYGATPFGRVERGEVYTLELGVDVKGRGYLGLEDMVVVTESGCEWISHPQDEIWKLVAVY